MKRRIQQYRRLFSELRSKRKVLLATHEHADGDALGSILALRSLLRQVDIQVDVLAPESSSLNFGYLDGVEQLVNDSAKINLEQYEAVVLLDCGDVKRTHLAQALFDLGDKRPFTAVIDHHPTATVFRDRDLVELKIIERSVTSTCELVYEFAVENQFRLTPAIATSLLTGIITDTGGFMNLATTIDGMETAAELMKRGANLRKIVSATVRSKSVGILHLWGRALSRLEYDPTTEVVSTALTLKDFEDCGVEREGSEGIANFLNGLGEGKVVLVLREEPNGQVKGSFRTKHPDVDVAAMAAKHGGGGHKKAAGFNVPGKIVKLDLGWSVDVTSAN